MLNTYTLYIIKCLTHTHIKYLLSRKIQKLNLKLLIKVK